MYVEEEMSMAQLKQHYRVGISTIHKWLHAYGIPTRQRVNGSFRGLYKEIHGVMHKRCPSPNHEGERYLPDDGNYFYEKKNGPDSWCIRCRGNDGRVVVFSAYYKGWIKSIVARLGVMETCRRLGISYKTYWNWNKHPPKTIRRKQARAIVHVMRELRHTGEVRHRNSIKHGASARGHEERKVIRQADLYIKHGDNDAENRKRKRQDPEYRERERKLQNAARRRKRLGLTET